jgi:hypothetical protein
MGYLKNSKNSRFSSPAFWGCITDHTAEFDPRLRIVLWALSILIPSRACLFYSNITKESYNETQQTEKQRIQGELKELEQWMDIRGPLGMRVRYIVKGKDKVQQAIDVPIEIKTDLEQAASANGINVMFMGECDDHSAVSAKISAFGKRRKACAISFQNTIDTEINAIINHLSPFKLSEEDKSTVQSDREIIESYQPQHQKRLSSFTRSQSKSLRRTPIIPPARLAALPARTGSAYTSP